MTVVNLHQFVFQKNNLLFGWNFKDNNWAYLRAEVNGFRENNPALTRIDTLFDNVIADVIQKVNDKSTVGLQVHKYLLRQTSTLDKEHYMKLEELFNINMLTKKP